MEVVVISKFGTDSYFKSYLGWISCYDYDFYKGKCCWLISLAMRFFCLTKLCCLYTCLRAYASAERWEF